MEILHINIITVRFYTLKILKTPICIPGGKLKKKEEKNHSDQTLQPKELDVSETVITHYL